MPDNRMNMNVCNTCSVSGNYPIAMAYVPWQQWSEVYDLNKGFRCGTIFPCLNKPFEECNVCRGGMR